jgi:hypothetical protein
LCVLLGCVIRGRLLCHVVSAAVSVLVIWPDPVDNDPPAGRGTPATHTYPLKKPLLDEVALGPADHGEAVLGERCELGAPQPVAELTSVIGDLGHHPEHCPNSPGRDARLGRQVKVIDVGRECRRHGDPAEVCPGMTARRFHGNMETLLVEESFARAGVTTRPFACLDLLGCLGPVSGGGVLRMLPGAAGFDHLDIVHEELGRNSVD